MSAIAQVRPERPRCRVSPSALALMASARLGLAAAQEVLPLASAG
jgi:hypothetical protein